MNIEEYRNYCLAKEGVTESFPFDKVTLVFKVNDKIFALVNTGKEFSINLKCEPEKAIELREHYSYVLPGYHMDKKHWNTIITKGRATDQEIKEWTDESYLLVLKKSKVKK